MLIAKFNTKEIMQDGSPRSVKAGEPALNPATFHLPRIEHWFDSIDDNCERAIAALARVPKNEVERYYKKKVVEPIEDSIIDAEVEEIEEADTIDENAENSDIEETEKDTKVEEVEDSLVVDTGKYDSMSNSNLKSLLKESKVEYKNSMNKATLMKLCAENNL